MRKIFLITFLLCVGAACSSPAATPNTRSQKTNVEHNKVITVGTQKLKVFFASTDALRAQGLSGVAKLEDNQGMLFEFSGTPYDKPGFWMKNMKINLDILWIRNGKIIGITKNVPAPVNCDLLNVNCDDLPLYYPPSVIDKVLEVNAGWSEQHKIKIGDEVTY